MKKRYGDILHGSGDVSCYEDSGDNQKVSRFAEFIKHFLLIISIWLDIIYNHRSFIIF